MSVHVCVLCVGGSVSEAEEEDTRTRVMCVHVYLFIYVYIDMYNTKTYYKITSTRFQVKI